MSQISLTASMRSNLLSLQGTSQLMSQTQERLANGKKVNSAIDNASAYYTAQSLSNRASDLSNLLDSMGQAISTIKAANEGIEAITSFVEQAKAVATSASDTADDASRASYGKQFNSIIEQLDKLSKDSGYKGINLLQGDKLTVIFNEARDNKLEISGVTASASNLGLTEQDWDAAGKDEVATAKTAMAAKEKIYNTAATKAETADVVGTAKAGGAGSTSGKIAAAEEIANGATVYIKVGSGNDAKFYKLTATAKIDAGADIVVGSEAGQAVELKTDGNGKFYAVAAEGTAAKDAYDDFKDAKTDYEDAYKAAVKTVSDSIQNIISKATAAIDTLRGYASDFGTNYSIVQNRQNFTENLINVLEEGADNLVLADMNEESANMLALQTRQQLAINSLSLASQASQSVLRLFS